MVCPKAILFDLDDTLAPPHVPLSVETAQGVARFTAVMPVAVVTAAPFHRIMRDFVDVLPAATNRANLYIFSENAAQCRRFDGGSWKIAYGQTIALSERSQIRSAIQQAIDETSALEGVAMYSERILDREAGVTLATLGQKAPQVARQTWDPDQSRRRVLYDAIVKKLPHWHVYIGGLTSIDISREDVSKARAVEWLSEHLQIKPSEMLYIGDALYEGGNDFPAIATGIQTRGTSGPEETLTIIDELLAVCTT